MWFRSWTGNETARGTIEANRFLSQQYEARVTVIERNGVPLAFGSETEFRSFSWETRSTLALSGNADAEPYLRGSSVTGYRYENGEPFDFGTRSDLDFAVVSPRLLQRAQDLGIQTLGKGTRTFPLSQAQMEGLQIGNVVNQIGAATGRRSTIVIFRDATSLDSRGPNVRLP